MTSGGDTSMGPMYRVEDITNSDGTTKVNGYLWYANAGGYTDPSAFEAVYTYHPEAVYSKYRLEEIHLTDADISQAQMRLWVAEFEQQSLNGTTVPEEFFSSSAGNTSSRLSREEVIALAKGISGAKVYYNEELNQCAAIQDHGSGKATLNVVYETRQIEKIEISFSGHGWGGPDSTGDGIVLRYSDVVEGDTIYITRGDWPNIDWDREYTIQK